ncbi:MAG: serine hydrolase domain-containing protein [Gemmatimonadota bacterium]|nr:serine hydrolase domain-containing protein [Gemmatimonadota bacterium]
MLKYLILVIGSAVFLSCSSQAPVKEKTTGSAEKEPDRGIFEMLCLHTKKEMKLSYNCSAGAALVMREGRVLYEEYFGATHRGPGAEPVGVSSRFPFYSVSKGFGCGLLMSLITDNLLALDDPVVKYLPYFTGPGPGEKKFPREKVTIRHLASHTSGVAHSRSGEPEAPDNTGRPRFDDVTLEFEPGTGWHYNELGMKILGAAMEKAAGKPYDRLLKERILEPLGLETVGYVYPGDDISGVVHSCYGPDSTALRYTQAPYPGSGLYGSIRDMARYAQLWLDGGKAGGRVIFREGLIREAWKTHIPDPAKVPPLYNYGLMFWLNPELEAAINAGAAQTVTAILPEKNMIVLVGLNQRHGSPGWGRPPIEHGNVARIGLALADLMDRQRGSAK